ncbi:acyltransferase family protein [Acidisoma silvae]|uniref:Acyltransferase n=1 Tax=Acidisoma silvae TaxID=2802396 RepID=A0A963YVW3_9PROT|nr:acyltransferase [Acidisoma silvae]MCB8878167.1 acyltransferase [Acidisoma silvae]
MDGEQIEFGKTVSLKPTLGSARDQSYIYGLDFLRFLAASLVALFHLTWLEPTTAKLAWFGWIGVQIFFVISGFVISQSAQTSSVLAFAISRFLRLYPAAWICALISLVALLCRGNMMAAAPSLLLQFFRSLVLYPTGPFLATAYWTLPVEITFYGLIAIVLYRHAFRHIEAIALVMAIFSGLYLAFLGLYYLGAVNTSWIAFGYGWKNVTLLRHGVYFSGGIFCWLTSEKKLTWQGIIGLAIVAIAAPIEIICRTAELVPLMPVSMKLSSVSWVPLVIWIAAVVFILAAARWRAEVNALPSSVLRAIRLLGLTTYPFYLVHEVVGHAARHVFLARGGSTLISAVGGVLVSAFVAFLIAYQAEPRLRRLLRAWIKSLEQGRKRLA